MQLIIWDEELSVGIRSIDDQHKKLISMINELHDAMLKGRGKELVEKILDGLVHYTVEHFDTEERLFETYGYPDSSEHKSQHRLFVDKVKDFERGLHEGKFALSVEIFSFLSAWLKEHIKGSDKQYAPFLKKQGIA